jgi:hypothetical protein
MIDRLPLDEQATEYVDAFMSVGWDAEVAYRHTLYPQINPKKGKEAPALTPSGKPSKAKSVAPETLEEFADRLLEDVLQTRPEHYFDEQILWFPKDHMDDYRAGRWGTAQDIIAARRVFRETARRQGTDVLVPPALAQEFPMNSSRCWEYGGCEFIPLCTKLPGAEALYEIVQDNPELTHGKEDEGVTSEYAEQ